MEASQINILDTVNDVLHIKEPQRENYSKFPEFILMSIFYFYSLLFLHRRMASSSVVLLSVIALAVIVSKEVSKKLNCRIIEAKNCISYIFSVTKN